MIILDYVLILLSGFLITLPFSFPDLFFISWIGLLPFLFVIEHSTTIDGLKKGTVMGIVIFLITTGWLYYPLVEFSGLPWFLCIFILLILFILLGLIYGIWAWIYKIISGKGIKPIILAFSWVTIEFLRYKLLSALPFAYLGYTQVNFLHFLQLAELGGVFIVSFLVIIFNGYFYKFFKERRIRFLFPIAVIMLFIFIFGIREINYYQQNHYRTINLGIVQSNLNPQDKWDVRNIEKNMEYFVKESEKMANVELIIWPESSLTFDLIRNEYYRKMFMEKLKRINVYIQAGSLAIIEDEDMIYNSSFLISPENEIVDRYNKVKLVPFGEYLPFSNIVKMLTGYEMVSEIPGDDIVIFKINSISWKTAICSEILYPELVSKGLEEAGFVVNQSNEAWYKRGNLQQQMWTAATFRAVENRVSIVKAGNKAYGGGISPWGEDIINLHSQNQNTLRVSVPINNESTFYQKYAYLIGYICTGFTFLLMIIRILLKRFI